MKVILFPYDSESEPLIRYSTLLSDVQIQALVAPSGFGMNNGTVSGDKVAYTILQDMADVKNKVVDALMIVESFHKISNEILISQIEAAAKRGLNIILMRKIKEEEHKVISNICSRYGVQLLDAGKETSFILNKDIDEIKKIDTPLIAVLGSGERCNKFELQLEINRQLS